MKVLILSILLACNLVFANSRFTEADRTEFIKDVKFEIAEFKQDNNGKIDLIIIKPAFYQELEKYYQLKKFTKEEMVKIKEAYEVFSSKKDNVNNEEKFYAFVEEQLTKINSSNVDKIKKGGICNTWVCEDNLKCVTDPQQKTPNDKCSKALKTCQKDTDCCSGSCVDSLDKKGVKVCEVIKRCYQSVKLGSSCKESPVCEQGLCLPFDANTIGIGECAPNKKVCKSNDECCSGLCENNKCQENIICKDCVGRGQKAEGSKKCCEGLIKNGSNICIPDMPPMIPPEASLKNKIFKNVFSLLINSASADEAFSVINNNKSKYSNYIAKSEEADGSAKDLKKAKAEINFTKKSNFDTCDIHFREDYYAYLKQNKLFDMEVSLLAFDFVMLGDANHDYWRTSKGAESTSIYGRLNQVAQIHDRMRNSTNDKIEEVNRKLTCLCIDIQGVDKIKDSTKVAFFNEKCDEYKNQLNTDANKAACATLAGEKAAWEKSCIGPNRTLGDGDCSLSQATLANKEATCTKEPGESSLGNDPKDGSASGLKAKRMLVFYSAQMSAFNQSLTVDNTKVFVGISKVKNWIETNQEKFSITDYESYDGLALSQFTIKNPSGSAAALGAVLGAILAAGVIAVVGGFATTSMISTWAAAGIISAAAASGAGGVWLVASLKGAWITKQPQVYDKYVRSYGCGKKDTCTDYTRMLRQPYSNICDAHIASPACIKNFVTYNFEGEERYVVDPFIPYGVSKDTILRGQGDYAKSLEAGYRRALDYMQKVSPRGQVGEGIMSSEFINEYIVGLYTIEPGLGERPESRYAMEANVINEIKAKAKAFAIKTKFLESGDTQNLENFANYAYEYHFLWPKTSRKKEISYPTVAFDTYLDFMSMGVTASLAAGGSNAAVAFGGLNTQYLQDYLNTLKIYAQQTSGLDADELKKLNSEIAATEAAIAANKIVLGYVNDKGSDLLNLNSSAITSSQQSANGSGASLSSGQLAYLNAVGNYRKVRNEQLKKLELYNKAVAANGSTSVARTAAVSNATKSFSAKFASAAIGSKSGLFGSAAIGGVKNSTAVDTEYSLKANGVNNIPTYTSGGNGSSSSSRSSSASGSGSSSGSGASGATASAEDEDSKRLNDAIDARNKDKKDKYSSNNNENTLFEKVTNAYIRNYDKVLTKKKQDKDVTDQKE